jgi:hypothetical protein
VEIQGNLPAINVTLYGTAAMNADNNTQISIGGHVVK